MRRSGEHAMVLGANMAGLAMAAALAPRFDRVTVVDRDVPSDVVEPRRGVRCVRRPEQLRGSPLLRSRLVLDRDPSDPIATLAGLIELATDALRDRRGGDKWHRAVATTFFKGAPTQEEAAERLGLPFSTYRRHLTSGIAAVSDHLWERELHGTNGAHPQR